MRYDVVGLLQSGEVAAAGQPSPAATARARDVGFAHGLVPYFHEASKKATVETGEEALED